MKQPESGIRICLLLFKFLGFFFFSFDIKEVLIFYRISFPNPLTRAWKIGCEDACTKILTVIKYYMEILWAFDYFGHISSWDKWKDRILK